MDIQIKVENLGAVAEVLKRLSGKEAKVGYKNALNDTGFYVRLKMQAVFKTSFDHVTPWIARSPKVFMATPDKLSVSIAPTLSTTNAPSTGGKVGVDPQDVLQAQEFGGKRRDKRSESALRRAGILPQGMQTAIPRIPFPGSDDGRGNLRGAFLQQLLSYLQAYSEQGYKANMSDKRKAGIHKGTAKTQGRRYVVAYGKMRGGSRTTRTGEADSRASNLAPGIWAVTGSGAVVKPVLMFIRPAGYRPLISMDRIARESGAQDYLDKRLRFRIRQVAGI